MRVGLTYTQMKLGWGYKRLDELKREVAEFRKDSYLTHTQDDLENSRYRFHIEQKITPDAIGMLVGEFAYALRSSLDHLAWQLALLTTDKPSRQTAFPIESQMPLPSSRGYRDKVADILPQALPIIDSLQPYKSSSGFRDHPLWQLNRLCNIDKHQVVAVGHVPYTIVVAPTVSGCWWRDMRNGIEISVPLADKSKFRIEIECPSIVFGDPIIRTNDVADFEIGLEGLERIYNFIRSDAVPRFEIFLT
jgi:hypothetical protein